MVETESAINRPRGAPTSFTSASLHQLQVRHFFLFDLFPLLGTVAAFILIPWAPPNAADVACLAVLWLVTGLGLTVGFHRYFSHGAFSTSRPVSIALLIAGSMAARGPMISWAAMHRLHHQNSDHEGDLHSPNLHGPGFIGRMRGFLHAHLTWMMRHDYPNVMYYVPDLMAQKDLVRCNRLYYSWVALGLAVPTLVGAACTFNLTGALIGFLWGGAVRIFLVEHAMSAINSLCHLFGSRPYKTRDDRSGNIPLLGPLTWGEAWHNNHHAFPHSAAFGLRWYELDPGYWFVCLLQALGLVWDVKRPAAKLVAERRFVSE